MFGIGETEFVIILIFAFLIFGPDKLPGMGRTIGRAFRQFRDAQDNVTKVVQSEIVDPINSGMNEPAAKKRAEAAKAAQAEDADIESASGAATATATAAKPETFAQRKARLERERKAKENSEAQTNAAFDRSDTDEAGESRPGADSDEDLPAAAKTRPVKPSLADLYAMTPKSHAALGAKEESVAKQAGAPSAAEAKQPQAETPKPVQEEQPAVGQAVPADQQTSAPAAPQAQPAKERVGESASKPAGAAPESESTATSEPATTTGEEDD